MNNETDPVEISFYQKTPKSESTLGAVIPRFLATHIAKLIMDWEENVLMTPADYNFFKDAQAGTKS